MGGPDAPAWWAEPGRPGYAPDVSWGTAYPWTLAGHVLGAWAIEDADRARESPHPGVMTTETPLAWIDSLWFESGDAAWRGYQGSIARARLHRHLPARGPTGRPRAMGDLAFSSGSSAYDGNALTVVRGDSARWLRVGSVSWNRGGMGALAPAGRHHYDVSGAWTRGKHRLEMLVGQSGSAAALVAGEEQAATGAGGSLRYALELPGALAGVEVARGYDHHESYGGFLNYSRRDAHQRRVAADLNARRGHWGARVEVRDAWVTRVTEFEGEDEWKALSVWAAARGSMGAGPWRFEGALGAGRHDAVGGTQVAPSGAVSFGRGAWRGRISLERVVAPVWSDLAAGEPAFLQSTIVGGIELAATQDARVARVGWKMGRTRGRAVAARLPFEELWLRAGFAPDPEPYDFGLATGAGSWQWRGWTAAAEGYALFRDQDAPGVAVDPRRAGRATLDFAFRAFRGDLGMRLRGELEVVGGRFSEAVPARGIPRHESAAVGALVTLADVTLTAELRNLENRRRPLTWIDPLTGQEALGEGMEFRLGLAWRLYN